MISAPDPTRAWPALNELRLATILRQMIDIYSPSGKEEDIQLYLEELLRAGGLQVRRQEVEEERYNLIVSLGEREPRLYLVGHVDTIAAWDLSEYVARQEDGLIYGLGSADMKGGCAAMVEAFLTLAQLLPPAERPPVGLLLVVGEEENGDGSAAFLESCRPPWVVIGEPTGLMPNFAHYGYLEAVFTTIGRRTHSSLPELGHNAVESMLRVLLHLGRDPLFFDRGRSGIIYSIREMTSSQAGFVVPDRCETWIDLHLPPEMDPAVVEAAIRNRAEGAKALIPDLKLEFTSNLAARGYSLDLDNPLARQLSAIYPKLQLPWRCDSFRSHSDGNLFHQAGVKPLILGPGALEVAHTPEEYTPLHEVVSAAKIYLALCLLAENL
ncbi:M20 family metallopeptidase [Desulfurivibrio sp. C05AmB]|jgi:acetylornithine deacetylase|uniref:M20 family metallopeptidase n=1 Tax=Desulfurivibrio sp. C05AmB TaxID=3374371 RepID=UPI00376F0623